LHDVFTSDRKQACELNLKTKKTEFWPVRLESIVEHPVTLARCRIAVIDIADVVVARRQIQQANEDLEKLTANLLSAHEDERRRVALELHDDFGQRIVGLEMEASRLASLLRKRKAAPWQEVLDSMQRQIESLGKDIRNASHRLHPSILAHFGLVAALENLVREFQGSELVHINLDEPSGPLVDDVALALFRITQEALQNVAKHARGAQVCINLRETDVDLVLTVEDAGPGFNLEEIRASGGLGLLSMRERARQICGVLHIETHRGSGTLLTVRVPRELAEKRINMGEISSL
jgi:signal transduction histidine kinase